MQRREAYPCPMLMPRDGGEAVHWWGTITSAKLFANAQLPVTVCNTSQCGAKRRCLDEEVEEEVDEGKDIFSFFSFLFLTPYLIFALRQLS